MGFPMPPSFESGVDCNCCIPTLWSAGQVPEYVGVTFSGMAKCHPAYPDPPNGHRFILKQDAIDFCQYNLTGATYNITWHFCQDLTKTAASLLIWWVAGARWMQYFIGIEVPSCQLELPNTIFCDGGPNDGGTGGDVMVQWGPDIGALEYNAQ